MLGLGEQVGRDQHRRHGVVGDHRNFRRTGVAVDRDVGRDLALRFGHVAHSRADDHVDRIDRLGAVREAAIACAPPTRYTTSTSASERGGEDRVVHGAVGARRRAERDVGHARDARRSAVISTDDASGDDRPPGT